ncbi:hypothetical protein P22_0177 [Propionispora sp. 2/2-37]|uniref:hypothetical protein n=1 Tax=Propionispora sp. 2/2-37 TaxID=1677858 RepID=UPI0006BB8AB9|nr:hypothetical protein [Propionispora sp. 2/2-37]CUH94115.1 hypothetical protein P22_0177 [Propionispora sp. 2/2-37]
MWIFLPAFYLAVAHIAGDNVAVIPDMAVYLSYDTFISTILAYIILGAGLAGVAAWIGIQSKQELSALVKIKYGCWGKRILAVTVLSVCLPASALTGGYYAGQMFQKILLVPQSLAIPLSLLLFSFLAAGYGKEVLKVSNYIALLLIPITGLMMAATNFNLNTGSITWVNINWPILIALLGYNIGGMRTILTIEAAACLAKQGYKTIFLITGAKLFEGLFTLAAAQLVLAAGTAGPLALADIPGIYWGKSIGCLFHIALFCTFMNTMAPAMMVNARQISALSGWPFWPSLVFACLLVYLGSYLQFNYIIQILSFTGLSMVVFILYTAYLLNK